MAGKKKADTIGYVVPGMRDLEEDVKKCHSAIHPNRETQSERETARQYDVLTTNLSIAELELSMFTPRLQFDAKYIDELAEDIRENGQQKPIICRPHPEKPNVYQVVDGETRVRALKQNASSSVRAEVRKLSDKEAMYLALHINQLHGKRLHDIEEALHIQKMMAKQNLSEQDIARRLKRSQSWVSRRLTLVTALSPKAKNNAMARGITSSHARHISKLPNKDQDRVVDYVAREKPSVKEIEYLVEKMQEEPSKAEQLLTKDKLHLKADMKHGEVMETSKRLEEVIAGKDRKQWVQDHVCVDCGKRFRIIWKEGTIEWT
jgi:ParB family chromosome partitioning protein